jgi:hypothetical protein
MPAKINTPNAKKVGVESLEKVYLETWYCSRRVFQYKEVCRQDLQDLPLKPYPVDPVRIYYILARIIKHSCTYIKVGREGNKHRVWDPFP